MTKTVKCAKCGGLATCPECGSMNIWIDNGKLDTLEPPPFKLRHSAIKHQFTDYLRRFIKKFEKDNELPPSFSLRAEIGLNQVIMMTDCLDESLDSMENT